MKIAIDGFALGLREGTGLTTATYELAQLLGAHGHEVSVIYGLNGIGTDPDLTWPLFVQTLAVRGQSRLRDWPQWGPRAAAYLLPSLARRPIGATPVRRDPAVSLPHSTARVPAVTEIFNAPSIFQASQAFASVFRRPLALRRLPGVELFHRTSPLPMRMNGAANVVTVHDVIPLALPQSTAINLGLYRRIMQASLKEADALFVVSEHSKRDLLAFFDVPEERVVVTYQAVNIPPTLRNVGAEELERRLRTNFDLAPGGYFLFYGAIEPKKNVMRILDAHAMAKHDLPLVIVGRNGWLYEQEVGRIRALLGDPRRAGRIRRHEYLPFEHLMLLLRGARALVFPSLYEGFGLPVLEAMLMGVPVITSNSSSLPEVAGDAALLVDPCDVGQIADAMDRLAGDDALRASLVHRGTEQVQRFSPEQYLRRLEEGYRRALG